MLLPEITPTGLNCIVNMPAEELKTMFSENEQMKADLKTLKTNILSVAAKLELMNPDGTFKEKPNMIKLVPKIMGYLSNSGAMAKDFGFVAEMLPMLSKYKDL